MSLHKKTAIGVTWNLLEQFGKRGVSGIVTIILARFLSPEEFGLIAMLTVFIQIANSLMESGFLQALIQKTEADQRDFCTVFYTNITFGLTAYAILYFSAPLISTFYEESRLVLIIRIVGISIVVNSFRIIQEAKLSKELKFKELMIASVPGALLSGVVAIGLAVIGAGVWALVAQIILSTLFTTLFLWFSTAWKPRILFSVSSFKSLFGYGSKLFLSGLINIVFQNIFVVVIAKVFSAQEAGYYFFAYKMQQFIVYQLNGAVLRVTFPALSSIQNQQNKLKKGFRQLLQVLTFIIFPIVIFIAALAEPIFKIFLSNSWLPAVPYMQLLLIAGMIVPLHTVNLNILKVKGRSDLFLYLEFVKKLFVIIVLIISLRFGISAILIGQIITSFIGYIPNSYFSNKLIGYNMKEQVNDLSFSFILTSLIGAVTFSLSNMLDWTATNELFVLSLLSVSVYFFVSYIGKVPALGTIYKIVKRN
jgi:O-antigen/teichoic acid export membrane protein